MDVKYQVFISSTFQDLREERRIVMEQILNLGHIPVGMELFQAGNDSQWAHIKRRIADCDYYLVIVAERYGSEEGGKSYTQLEYEWAIELEIPVAAFLLDDHVRSSWPAGKVEHDKRDKIAAFRALCQKKLVKYWANGDQLGARATTALVEMIRELPRPGWVRGDTAASPVALEEIARLSNEKRELQAEIEKYQSAGSLTASADITHRISKLKSLSIVDYLVDVSFGGHNSCLDAFIMISRTISTGATEFQIYEALKFHGIQYSRDWSAASAFLAELAANNLISVNYVQSGRDGTIRSNKVFSLTEYGKQLLLHAELETAP